MAFIRNTISAFQQSPLLAACAVVSGILASSTASFAQPAQTQSNTCSSFSPLHHSQPIFRDLKAVNLYIDIPPKYQEALDCHGREEDCVKLASGYGLPQFDSAKYIQNLKEMYDRYPTDLHPDVLTALYRDRLKTAFSSVLPRDSSCEPPEPVVLDRKTVALRDKSMTDITLTIIVTVVDTTKPPIAILTSSYFRSDPGHTDYLHSWPFSTAFPLDLPEPKIAGIVTDFANRTGGERPIADYVHEGSQ